jgi:site-specific DNA-cytosine methylase
VAWNSIERKQRSMVVIGESDADGANIYGGKEYRKLTPIECERLQTLPDDYTKSVSNNQRYKMIGNGWTVDVIAHIFSFISANKC